VTSAPINALPPHTGALALDTYEQVVDAYLGGLEDRVLQGRAIDELRSVASFFVSRVDARADRAIDELLAGAPGKTTRAGLEGLKGTLGVANAQLAYRRFSEISSSERWHRLAERGANPQRLLWASTSTKDPDAPDTLYVEALAAPDTVNTMPEKTLTAFADHGRAERVMPPDGGDAEALLAAFRRAGVDDQALAARLQREGAASFDKSWKDLLDRVATKRAMLAQTNTAAAGKP